MYRGEQAPNDADYARVSAEWNCFRLISGKAPYNGAANDWIHSARHDPRELERGKIRRKNAADNRACLMTCLESHGIDFSSSSAFSRTFPATFHAAVSRKLLRQFSLSRCTPR